MTARRYDLVRLDGEPESLGIATEAILGIVSLVVGVVSAAAGAIVPAVVSKRAAAAAASAKESARKKQIAQAQVAAEEEIATAQAALEIKNKTADAGILALAQKATGNNDAVLIGGIAVVGVAAAIFSSLKRRNK